MQFEFYITEQKFILLEVKTRAIWIFSKPYKIHIAQTTDPYLFYYMTFKTVTINNKKQYSTDTKHHTNRFECGHRIFFTMYTAWKYDKLQLNFFNFSNQSIIKRVRRENIKNKIYHHFTWLCLLDTSPNSYWLTDWSIWIFNSNIIARV